MNAYGSYAYAGTLQRTNGIKGTLTAGTVITPPNTLDKTVRLPAK